MEASMALSFFFIPGRSLFSFGQEHLLQKPQYQEELFEKLKITICPLCQLKINQYTHDVHIWKAKKNIFQMRWVDIFSSKNQLLIDKYLGNTHPLLALQVHKEVP